MRDGLATPTDRAGVRLHPALPQPSAQQSWGELRTRAVKRRARSSAWRCLALLVPACARLQARDGSQVSGQLDDATRLQLLPGLAF
jgi:hypothetical protein